MVKAEQREPGTLRGRRRAAPFPSRRRPRPRRAPGRAHIDQPGAPEEPPATQHALHQGGHERREPSSTRTRRDAPCPRRGRRSAREAPSRNRGEARAFTGPGEAARARRARPPPRFAQHGALSPRAADRGQRPRADVITGAPSAGRAASIRSGRGAFPWGVDVTGQGRSQMVRGRARGSSLENGAAGAALGSDTEGRRRSAR